MPEAAKLKASGQAAAGLFDVQGRPTGKTMMEEIHLSSPAEDLSAMDERTTKTSTLGTTITFKGLAEGPVTCHVHPLSILAILIFVTVAALTPVWKELAQTSSNDATTPDSSILPPAEDPPSTFYSPSRPPLNIPSPAPTQRPTSGPQPTRSPRTSLDPTPRPLSDPPNEVLPLCPCSIVDGFLPCTVRAAGSDLFTGTYLGINWDTTFDCNDCRTVSCPRGVYACLQSTILSGTGLRLCCYGYDERLVDETSCV